MTESTRRRALHILDALNAEWDFLVPNSRERTAVWAAKHEALAACRDLGDVLLAIRGEPDPALGALLTEVKTNDQLAGRTVLQAMLGKLVRMAQADHHGRIDDYVSAMWCQIGTYPLAARPTRIAANLVLDTLKQVTSERRLVRKWDVTLWPPSEQLDVLFEEAILRESLDHQGRVSELTAAELLESAAQLGLLDIRSKELLSSVYADGLSGKEAAQRYLMSAGAVRVRCSRAVRELVRHRSQLLAAA